MSTPRPPRPLHSGVWQLLTLATLHALLATNLAGQEAVTNGDFSASLSGWDVQMLGNRFQIANTGPTDMDGPGPKTSSEAFQAQVYGLGAGSSAGAVRLSQVVSLHAGQTYALHADVAMVNPGFIDPDRGTIQVRVGGQPLDALAFIAPSGSPE